MKKNKRKQKHMNNLKPGEVAYGNRGRAAVFHAECMAEEMQREKNG